MNSYQPTRIGAGMGLMLLAGFSFSGMDALLVKLALLTPDLSSPHRVFLRHLIGTPLAILVALVILYRQKHVWVWRFPGWRIALARGVLGFLMAQFFFASLERVGLGNAVLLHFTYPLVITLVSWPLLGDRVGVWRAGAVLIGFAGVAVATRGIAATDLALDVWGIIFALLGGVSFAFLMLSMRLIPKEQSSLQISVYGIVVTLLCSGLFVVTLVPLPENWVAQALGARWELLSIAVLGSAGVLCINQAYRFAPAIILGPLDYLVIIWAFLLEWWLFDHRPGQIVALGAALIIVSGLLILWREQVRATPEIALKRTRSH